MTIKECCPDMNLAVEEGLISDEKGQAILDNTYHDWLIDFCPFCGERIKLINCGSGETAKGE